MAKNTNESTDSTAKPAAGAAAAAPPAAATAAAPAESRPRKLFATRTIVHGDRIIRAGEELKGVPKDSLELLVQGGDAAESAPAPSQVKVNEVEMPPPPKEIPQ